MNLVQPTPDMRVFIRQELREPENPEDIEKDVAAIREWLKMQPHLPQDMGMKYFSSLFGFFFLLNTCGFLFIIIHIRFFAGVFFLFRRCTSSYFLAWLQIQFGKGEEEVGHVLYHA